MSVTHLSAPYNFVELSRRVCRPGDLDPALAKLPSHDVPMADGMSGSIQVSIECGTPILVNWAETRSTAGAKRFGRTPDGVPAIPGSSIRGMLRNVIEIISFGKMKLADDARTAVRDLSPTARLDYGNRMAWKKEHAFSPRTFAGWLRIDGGRIRLRPCSFARIDHDDLSKLSPGFRDRINADFSERAAGSKTEQNDLSQAERVEARFRENCRSLVHQLWVQKEVDTHHHSPTGQKNEERLDHAGARTGDVSSPAGKKNERRRDKKLRYRRAATTKLDAERTTPNDPQGTVKSAATLEQGTLVFTGMPSGNKHMEFFFYARSDNEVEVHDEVWRKFIDVHEKQERVSPTWAWRRPALRCGDEIPVFFTTDSKGGLEQIGLAMMFKLAADRTIGQMISQTSPDHRRDDLVDLPERLFGRLETKDKEGATQDDGLRGRISFGWAKATSESVESDDRDVRVILAKPKPCFPAAYVRQVDLQSDHWRLLSWTEVDSEGKDRSFTAQYRSYQAFSGGSKDTVRGWKRYPVRPPQEDTLGNPEGEGVATLRPLRPTADRPITFSMRIRYHNLHPVEFGALIWALTWGGDESLRHVIGMGRPLGWGQLRLIVALGDEQRKARTTFVNKMETWAAAENIPGGWSGSVQMRQLRAMANPVIGANEPARSLLRQMVLSVGTVATNEFADAKGRGLVLADYPTEPGSATKPLAGKDAHAKGRKREDTPPPRQLTVDRREEDDDLIPSARRVFGATQEQSTRLTAIRINDRVRCDGRGSAIYLVVDLVPESTPRNAIIRRENGPSSERINVSFRAIRRVEGD